MKLFAPLTALLGLSVLTALTAYYGFAPVGRAVASVGWGAGLVILTRVLELIGAGLGWGLLVKGAVVRQPLVFIGLRFIREAINTLFPVAQVGGDLIGGRLATYFGVAGGVAFASVLIDVFVQVATLLGFVLGGVGILLLVTDDHGLATALSWGLVAAVPAIGGFFVVLRVGPSNANIARFAAFAERRGWGALDHVKRLGESLRAIWGRPGALWASAIVHLSIWWLGALEVWIALTFMGHPVTLADAAAIESVGQAVRAAAFAMPGGLGIQDGGLIAVCGLFGISAEVALAVALVKRIAELALGIPGLIAWQALEGRKLLSSRGGP